MNSCAVFVCTDPALPIPAGVFALDRMGQGHFVYGRSYLNNPKAFAFDPVNLPLTTQQLRVEVHGDESFGVLSDSGPNAWGKKITGSICREKNKSIPSNPVEWLLSSYHYGSGCFSFSPDPKTPPANTILPVDFSVLDTRILKAFDNIDSEKDPDIMRIVLQGASLGGARPKTVVMQDGVECIVKFNRTDDLYDVSATEYASMRLAHLAKIDVPNFELVDVGGHSAFLVQRFDRTPEGLRIHYISANSLLNIGKLSESKLEYRTNYSYGGIAEILRPYNPQAVADSKQLYRRMVFNICIGNVDDHLRNHGFLLTASPNDYRLSPAFDVLPQLNSTFMPQSIGVGGLGVASTLDNALSQCGRFFLTIAEAKLINEEVCDVVSCWRSVFKDSGVSPADIHRLKPCFDVAESATKVR